MSNVPTRNPILRTVRGREVLVQLDGRLEAGVPPPPREPGDVASTADAASLVDTAQIRADELLREAASDVEAVRAKAHEAGVAAGYKVGFAEARDELAAALEVVQLAAREARVIRAQLLARIEPELVELVIEAVRAVVGDFVDSDVGLVRTTVERAVQRAGAQQVVRIRLHPDDVESVRAQLVDGADVSEEWLITDDATVTLGGCIVDTTHGQIDARLDVQLAELALRLRGAVAHVE